MCILLIQIVTINYFKYFLIIISYLQDHSHLDVIFTHHLHPLHQTKSFGSTLPLLRAKISQYNVTSHLVISIPIDMVHMSSVITTRSIMPSRTGLHVAHLIGTFRTSIHPSSIKALGLPCPCRVIYKYRTGQWVYAATSNTWAGAQYRHTHVAQYYP